MMDSSETAQVLLSRQCNERVKPYLRKDAKSHEKFQCDRGNEQLGLGTKRSTSIGVRYREVPPGDLQCLYQVRVGVEEVGEGR